MPKIGSGSKVKITYTLTVDGTVYDTTNGREPLEYVHGNEEIIPGLEKRLEGYEAGDRLDFVVPPQDAYGFERPEAYVEVPKSKFPQVDIQIGMEFAATSSDGRKLYVTVSEVRSETVVLNMNHPLAGKELHFTVEVLAVE